MHPSWVKCRRLEKTETILWVLEDSDSGKDEVSPKERERFPLTLAKEREQEKMEKAGAKSSGRANTPKSQGQCWNCGKIGHQFQGLLDKPWQMAAATESRIVKFSWIGK